MADQPSILSEVEELSQSFISISMNDELKETFEDKEQLAETEMQQLSDIESDLGSDKSEHQIIHSEVEEINKSFTAILLNDELSQTAADVEMDAENDENIHSLFSGEIAETEFIHGIENWSGHYQEVKHKRWNQLLASLLHLLWTYQKLKQHIPFNMNMKISLYQSSRYHLHYTDTLHLQRGGMLI